MKVKVNHKIEGAYGFILDLNGLKVGYTADTGFISTFKTPDGKEYSAFTKSIEKKEIEGPGKFNTKLMSVFRNVDILVFNLHDVEFRKHTKHNLYHSTVVDAIEILKDSKVKICFIEHFNPHGSLGPSFPLRVNEFIKKSTERETKIVSLNGLVSKLN